MDTAPKVFIGTKELIYSGVAVTNGYEWIDIFFVPSYRIRIAFEVLAQEPPVTFRLVNESNPVAVTVRAINFDAGGASNEPLHVANWLGRKVMLSLTTVVWGQPPIITRQTTYNLFWGGPQ